MEHFHRIVEKHRNARAGTLLTVAFMFLNIASTSAHAMFARVGFAKIASSVFLCLPVNPPPQPLSLRRSR